MLEILEVAETGEILVRDDTKGHGEQVIARFAVESDALLFLRAKQSQAWMWGQAEKPAVPETVHYVSGVAIPVGEEPMQTMMVMQNTSAAHPIPMEWMRFREGDPCVETLGQDKVPPIGFREGDPQELLRPALVHGHPVHWQDPPDQEGDAQPEDLDEVQPDHIVGGEG